MLNFRKQVLFVLATLNVVPPVLAAAVGSAPVLLLLMPLSATLASGQNIQSPPGQCDNRRRCDVHRGQNDTEAGGQDSSLCLPSLHRCLPRPDQHWICG